MAFERVCSGQVSVFWISVSLRSEWLLVRDIESESFGTSERCPLGQIRVKYTAKTRGKTSEVQHISEVK